MNKPKITVVVPHYKTFTLTKLCLRLLRKHSERQLIDVIVVDNDSQDDSLPWLRSIPWIKLIERKHTPGEPPQLCHSRALQAALELTTTPYFLAIHTDIFVKRSDWLDYLLKHIEHDDNIAGVGSWKLERRRLSTRLCKGIERVGQQIWFRVCRNHEKLERYRNRYIRCHCALYRVDAMKKHNFSFIYETDPPGQTMYRQLISEGYEIVFLPERELNRYVEHVNHATMVLNDEFDLKQSKRCEGQRNIARILEKLQAEKVLTEDYLDGEWA